MVIIVSINMTSQGHVPHCCKFWSKIKGHQEFIFFLDASLALLTFNNSLFLSG